MSFISATYVILLVVTFAVYWWKPRWQNLVLLAASLVFYGWWNVRLLLLMVGIALANFIVANLPLRLGKLAASVAVVLNLCVLGLFKYYDFFAAQLSWPLLNLVLPLGISFYTFQLTSYTIDVQRNPQLRERNVLRFLTFVCFFPQLVAGPIERASHLLPQLKKPRCFDRKEATEGMRLILWGLVKKMLVADNCAVVVNHVFSDVGACTTIDLWVAALCFAFQIYGDFSGYSDMAVGSAHLFGIRLSRNFDRPYRATSLPDFWRRWHITLMSWLRDYIYIPLGGNRKGKVRQQLNMLAVFLISGMWHGANWTFLVWGLYHAVAYIPFRRMSRPLPITTFVIVLLGWVIFRAENLTVACHYLGGMFGIGGAVRLSTTVSRLPLLLIALLMVTEQWGNNPLDKLHRFCPNPIIRLLVYYVLLMLTLYFGGEQQSFIYFQF